MTTAGIDSIAIDTLITFNPLFVGAEATIHDAYELFQRHDVRHLPVVDGDQRVVGVISDLPLRIAVESGQRGTVVGAGVATCPAYVVDRADPPTAALETMLSHGFHVMPVVDEGRLSGIISSTDFIRELSYGELPASKQPASRVMLEPDGQLDATDTIDDALAAMDRVGRDWLVVVKGACPIGVATRRNLHIASRHGGSTQIVKTALANVPAVRPNNSLAEVAGKMVAARATAAVVTDLKNELRGLVTEDVLLAAMRDGVCAETTF